MTDLNPCPSCGEPLDHPSGDGCANMTAHKERAVGDEELTQAMTDAVIFGTGVMQDGKRIDPQSFFVQPASDPACEHCGMDPAALTEQLTAAQHDAKEAEAYAEELEAKLAENEARLGKAVEAIGMLEDALQEAGDDYPGSNMQKWCQQQVKAARKVMKGESHD